MTLKINTNFSTIIQESYYDLNFYNVLRYCVDYVGAKEYFSKYKSRGVIPPEGNLLARVTIIKTKK